MSDENPSPLARAIARMGSMANVARALDLAQSTPKNWSFRGVVPDRYLDALEHVSEHGEAPPGWTHTRPGAPRPDQPAPTEILPEGHTIKGVSSYVDADGVIKGQWIKTHAAGESLEAMIVRLMSELPAVIPAREPVPAPTTIAREDLLAVYPIGDPHVGMLAWAEECGADFDLKIAEALMVGAIRDLVLRGPRTAACIVAPLGDTMHYDNALQRTTKAGHSLDADSRPAKAFRVLMTILTATVDAALEHHDLVTLDPQTGNHDGHTALLFALALEAHYRNEPRVTVIVSPAKRHYHEHGEVLICTDHGDTAKPEAVAGVMAAEQAQAWGRTRFRYVLGGHVHHMQRKELPGCVYESFRTLAPRDAHAAASGYYSGRDMHRIVYHAHRGEISREVVNVAGLA